MGVAASASPPAAPRARARGRIDGIDLARAIAIVGMVMAHIGPIRSAGGGLVGELYRLPHGRASILFVVVAGIGVALLADRRGATERSTAARLVWRALLLLPLGLALQELGTGVAVILQYYAVYFLIAIVALRLPSRALLMLAGIMSVAGATAVLAARRSQPEWFGPIPEWSEFGPVARDIFVSGTYPALVWVVPLLVGIWIGRQNLRSARVATGLLAAGAVLAAAAYGLRGGLASVAGNATSPSDWLQLAAIEPHNEMPLWVLSSTGIAVAIVGGAILLAAALPLLARPLVLMGQLALSVYVAHLLVLWQRPEWLRRDVFGDAWERVGIFLLVTLALVALWRAFAGLGPLETLFRAPWAFAERRSRRRAVVATPSRAELPSAAPSSL